MDDLLDYQVAPNENNNCRRFIGGFLKLIIVARYRPAAGQVVLTPDRRESSVREKVRVCSVFLFLLGGQFCGVAPSGDHPQEDLTKFGYKLNMKVEFFKNSFIDFWLTYLNYEDKSGDFFLNFGLILATQNLRKHLILALLVFNFSFM